jgi:hypothetical protein
MDFCLETARKSAEFPSYECVECKKRTYLVRQYGPEEAARSAFLCSEIAEGLVCVGDLVLSESTVAAQGGEETFMDYLARLGSHLFRGARMQMILH